MIELLDTKQNDSFSSLRGTDLQELLNQVETYFLNYRDNLGLSSATIGVEIEYEDFSKKKVDHFIETYLPNWKSKTDGSLSTGGEITSPIMKDKPIYWQELKTICDYLSQKGVNTSNNAGGHIHIGTVILNYDPQSWKQFLKIYTAYEHIIFRFIYGDKISARKSIDRYAPPIADKLHDITLSHIQKTSSMHEIISQLPLYRYQAINFEHVRCYSTEKNTIEFRSPNATSNAIIWQNNINAFAKMLITSQKKLADEDFLDYKLKHEFIHYEGNEYMYNEINLKDVLEFVDIIFDNNLDKIYFLRQYLKNFQNNFGLSKAIPAKEFVKSKKL